MDFSLLSADTDAPGPAKRPYFPIPCRQRSVPAFPANRSPALPSSRPISPLQLPRCTKILFFPFPANKPQLPSPSKLHSSVPFAPPKASPPLPTDPVTPTHPPTLPPPCQKPPASPAHDPLPHHPLSLNPSPFRKTLSPLPSPLPSTPTFTTQH